MNLLQTGNADTETMAFRLSEEYAKTEEKAKRFKSDIKELKDRNKELLTEVIQRFSKSHLKISWKNQKQK